MEASLDYKTVSQMTAVDLRSSWRSIPRSPALLDEEDV